MAKAARPREAVVVVDFGSQFAQLLARRIRELNVYSEIVPPGRALEEARRLDAKGIVLSGGPHSVYDADAPKLDGAILDLGVPVLGVCYGMQWLCRELGGDVGAASQREYGRAEIERTEPTPLLEGVSERTVVWMSHGDKCERLPRGFRSHARSGNSELAVASDPARKLFAVQFHPEVTHTAEGRTVLRNFLFGVCGLKGDWAPENAIEAAVAAIREQVKDGAVVLGLSGGVDSSVAAVLLQRALGPRLHCVFVDNGLLRLGEREQVERTFAGAFGVDLHVVDAADRFLTRLRGVTDPERKRKIVGAEFVDVFADAAKQFRDARYLGQGTLYPDVIESVSAFGGPTAKIKSHHNVGGLPEKLHFELVEPLRMLFKDEVRALGRALGLPPAIVERQPFPGPGLSVRCPGEVTPDRLDRLRRADAIVVEEIEAAGAHRGLWQYFAVLLPVDSVGVMGDARTYESACSIRIVASEDGMTADWVQLPRELLARISGRIVNEVRGINRVLLDVTSKPPGTIEWE